MDLSILDQYGLPLTLVIAFSYYIWKQTQYIQVELQTDMEESFKRLEEIIIKQIDQLKKTQMELAEMKGFVEGIEDILSRLILGKGVKHKDRNDN